MESWYDELCSNPVGRKQIGIECVKYRAETERLSGGRQREGSSEAEGEENT